jgi:hypothetical protein
LGVSVLFPRGFQLEQRQLWWRFESPGMAHGVRATRRRVAAESERGMGTCPTIL